MKDKSFNLDAEELLHLARKASELKDHGNAIGYLKELLLLDPSAEGQYLLAAEHAEIGMFEKAAGEMRRALELNPGLWTAYFQLGLLNLMLRKQDEARAAWIQLLKLPSHHYLHMFGAGLVLALDDKLSDAVTLLGSGIEANKENPALNGDVRKILGKISPTNFLTMDAVQADQQGSALLTTMLDAYAKNDEKH